MTSGGDGAGGQQIEPLEYGRRHFVHIHNNILCVETAFRIFDTVRIDRIADFESTDVGT
jgi:hypothetical protein